MDLMLDPACEYITFGDAVKVGWACDEERFFWYEDPYRDGGISQFAHRKLRQLIRTPLLKTEHVRSLEPHIDFVVTEATDFVRGDVGYDGITGVMKLAHACEGLGLDIEFHGPGPAQRQCMAAVRNTNYYEMGLVHPKAPASHLERPLHRLPRRLWTPSTPMAACRCRRDLAWASRSTGTGSTITGRVSSSTSREPTPGLSPGERRSTNVPAWHT